MLGVLADYKSKIYPRPKRRLQTAETSGDPQCTLLDPSNNAICETCNSANDYYYMLVNPNYVGCAYSSNSSAGSPCSVETAVYSQLSGEFTNQTDFVLSQWAPYLGSDNYCVDQQFYGWTSVCLAQRNISQYMPFDWEGMNSQSPVFNFTTIRESVVMNSVNVYCDLCVLNQRQYIEFLDPFNSSNGAYTPLQMYYVGCANKTTMPCDQYSIPSSSSPTGCTTCNKLYDNCLACNTTQCTVCPLGYYWNPSVWDINQNAFVGKCQFQQCPAGYCLDIFGYQCYKSTLSNCVKCSAAAGCLECEPGYISDPLTGECNVKGPSIDTRPRFVRPLQSGELLAGQPLNTNPGLTVETAAFSIQKVIGDIYTGLNNGSYTGVNLNIYILSGTHTLLTCTGDPTEAQMFSQNTGLQNFCSELMLYRQDTAYDGINITIQALDCNFQSNLGYTSDAYFTTVCVDISSGDLPNIMVNNLYSYFNITGFWSFINLNFDATNTLVVDPLGQVDYSVIPTQLCQITSPPTGYDELMNLTQVPVPTLNLGYQCFDNYNPTRFPNSTAYKCQQTNGLQLKPYLESTLACTRTFDDTDYFFMNPLNAYSKKQKTLFNLYAFAAYQSEYPLVPSLYILNCTFQYFYGGFDSLINLEQGTLSKTYYNGNAFYLYYGRISGGNVTISQSSVKNSRFCRGMIFFRRMTYSIDYSMSLSNQTYHYDDASTYGSFPYLNKTGIVLDTVTVFNANSYKYVTALANYGGLPIVTPIVEDAYQPVMLLQPIHVGIAINVEDYPGYVIVKNSVFDKNMHYIGEYNNTITFDTERQESDSFIYISDDYTSEYKLAMCEDYLSRTYQLFGHAFYEDEQSEMEDYFDIFERLSLIYISRGNGLMYFENNTFTNNIGTYGGAITINTPMWSRATDSPPQITFIGNNFTSNMAYFSGNAIYIRTAKNATDYNSSCSNGIMLDTNYFGYNIGTKLHNGGAVSVVCTYLDYNYLIETSSSITKTINQTWFDKSISEEMLFGMTRGIFSNPVGINIYDTRINNSIFEYNFAGQNGSAIFLSYPSNITVNNSTFSWNSAVYSFNEILYSPFVKYLSHGVPFTFYDQIHNFTDEVDFMVTKGPYTNDYSTHPQFSGNIAQYSIQYPYILGALTVYFCQLNSCVQNMVEIINITNSTWQHNFVGPLLIDNYQSNLASCLYIIGSQNISFYKSIFFNNSGPEQWTNYAIGNNYTSFINNQTSYSQSTMISIQITNDLVTQNMTQYVSFIKCNFSNNMNYQYYDNPGIFTATDSPYLGQLINLVTNYAGNTGNFAVYFIFYNNTVFNNTFLGASTSQIYVQEVVAKFYYNTFIANGALVDPVTYYQEKSVVNIVNSQGYYPYWQWCECISNEFHFNMGELGAGFAFDVAEQTFELRDNYYHDQIAQQYGAAITIYETATYSNSFFNLTNEVYYSNFGINVYFFTIYDNNVTQCMIVVRNCIFNKMNSNVTALGFYSENLYGLFLINNTFSQIQNPILKVDQERANASWYKYYIGIQASVLNDKGMYPKFSNSSVNNTYYLSYLQTYIYTFNQGAQNWDFWINWYNWQTNSLYNLIGPVIGYASSLCPGADIEWQYANLYNNTFSSPTPGVINHGVFHGTNSYVYYYSSYLTLDPITNPSLFINQDVKINGAITVDTTSTFYGYNMMFNNNSGVDGSGSLINIDNSVFQIQTAVFTNNWYDQSTLLQITGDSTFNCYSCNFTENYASNGVIYGRGKIQSNILIINAIFLNNMGDEYMIYLSSCLASLTNINFTNSLGSQVIIISDATLNFNNNNVTYDDTLKTNSKVVGDQSFQLSTGFFYAAYNSILSIGKSVFFKLDGQQSAVLYASEGSIITISNSKFLNSTATSLGGIVYFLGVDLATISNCEFFYNGDLDIELDNSELVLTNSQFYYGGNQYIQAQKSGLTVQDCSFQYVTSDQNIKITGGAIECDCSTFSVTNSKFNFIQAYQGGAIYLESYQNGSFTLSNNEFVNCTARQGGAVYINDAQKMVISNNSFYNNTVTYSNTISGQDDSLGGALYLQCDNVDLGLQGNCKFTVKSNRFYNNTAAQQGGAMMWILPQIFNYSQNSFYNNFAPYGPNYGSFATQISVVFVSANDPSIYDIEGEADVLRGYQYNDSVSETTAMALQNEATSSNRRLQGTYGGDTSSGNSSSGDGSGLYDNTTYDGNGTSGQGTGDSGNQYNVSDQTGDNGTYANGTVQYEFNIVSGTPFAFNVTLLDQFGQVVTSDSESKALITANKSTSTITFKNNQQTATNGVYQFTNTIIIVKPGTNFTVQLDFIGVNEYGIYTFGPSIASNLTNVTVVARDCVIGEEYTQDGRCQRCDTTQYSIVIPSDVPPITQCKACDPPTSGMNCLGGSIIVPLPGFQRSIYHYDSFVSCPIPKNCIQGTIQNRSGFCAPGYFGIVCAQCDPGYSQVKEFQCQECPDRVRNIIQIAFILFIGIIVIVLLVRSTLSSSSKIKPAYSVYLKIMANHFQILSAIGNIDYQWPSSIQNYYNVQNNVATASQQLYSFDCILNQKGDDPSFPIFFQKLTLIGSIPIIAVTISMCFWSLYFFIQRRRGKDPQNFGSNFVSTLVVMLFIFHPDIAKYMFLSFNCQRIDGVNRLKFNVESVCYQGQHLFFTLSVVIPSVVLWVFGIPFVAILIMARYRTAIRKVQTLDNEIEIDKARDSVTQMQMYYGFLFNGYNAERFYWETVIILRKVFIIMGAVFFSSVSSESQILVALLIVLLSLILQNSLKPYYSDTLNRMEVMSLTVAAFTMYTGMYYVTGSHYDYMDNQAIQYILLLTLATPNVVFLCYWMYHMRIEILKELYKKKWYSFIQVFTLQKFEEKKFYEKYLKDDEAFDVQEESGELQIKYVGIELHQQLTKFESMRSSEFQTSFATSKMTSQKSKNKNGVVAISPMDRMGSFNSTMKFMEETQDEPEIDTARGNKNKKKNKRKLNRKQDTFDQDDIEEIKDEEYKAMDEQASFRGSIYDVNLGNMRNTNMGSRASNRSNGSDKVKKKKKGSDESKKGGSSGSNTGSQKHSSEGKRNKKSSDEVSDHPVVQNEEDGLQDIEEIEELQDFRDENDDLEQEPSPQDNYWKGGDNTAKMNPIDMEINKMKLNRKQKKEQRKKPEKQATTMSDIFD